MFSQRIGRSGRHLGLMARRGAQQGSGRRCYADAAGAARGSTGSTGRVLGLLLYGVGVGGVGAAAMWYKMMGDRLGVGSIMSDADSLTAFNAQTEEEQRIEQTINSLALVKELRSRPEFTESRPHLKMADEFRRQSLTAGSLRGAGKLVVPPYMWLEDGGKSLVSVGYAGGQLCGYPGKIHGGFLATMLDESMARCCFPAVPHNIAMTARLEVDYRKPAPADDFFVLRARTVKVEGRKAWVEAHIETLPKEGEKPVVLVEAKSLFISPKFAPLLPKLGN